MARSEKTHATRHTAPTFLRAVRRDTHEGNSTTASASVSAALLVKVQGVKRHRRQQHTAPTFLRTVRKDTYEGNSTRANLSVSAALFVKVQDCHHFGLQAIGMAAQLPTLVAICRQQLTLSRMILARHRGRKHVSYMNNKHQKSKCKNSHSLE